MFALALAFAIAIALALTFALALGRLLLVVYSWYSSVAFSLVIIQFLLTLLDPDYTLLI